MKRLSYKSTLLSFAFLGLLFSCTSKKIGFFNNTNQRYVHEKKSEIIGLPSAPISEPAFSASMETEPNLEIIADKVIAENSKTTTLQETSSSFLSVRSLASKTDRKTVKNQLKAVKKELKTAEVQRTGIGTLLLVIIAIILPPLAVLLVDGLRGPFWLSILLTLLFYIPGLIYALFRVFKGERTTTT